MRIGPVIIGRHGLLGFGWRRLFWRVWIHSRKREWAILRHWGQIAGINPFPRESREAFRLRLAEHIGPISSSRSKKVSRIR